MIYLTTNHHTPPAYVRIGDMLHPTAEAIAANDTARLAELDIWPHVTTDGDAPLGYTDWIFADGVYSRHPADTAEEIATAIAAQAVADLEAWRASTTCSPAQGRLALLAAGLLDTVEAWIATQPRAVQIEYEARTVWRRDWPLIETARVAMGWTQEKVDELFQSAQAL